MKKKTLDAYLQDYLVLVMNDLQKMNLPSMPDWLQEKLMEKMAFIDQTLDLMAKGWHVALISPKGEIFQ